MFGIIESFKKNYYRNRGQRLLLHGQPEKAYPYLEKALLMDGSTHNMYNLALSLLAMQRFEEAESYLRATVEESPNNALAVLTLADLYMQKRDWDKAEEILSMLCDAYPGNMSYRKYYNTVSDPKLREKYIRAKELLNQSKESIESGKFDKALQELHQAEKYDPDNPYIQSNLGSLYLRVKDDAQKAFSHFHKAYKLNPENKGFKENMETARKLIAK